jgi:hypothetical protein
MNQPHDESNLPIRRLAEVGVAAMPADLIECLEFRVIAEPDDWLNTAYQLLAEQFEPDVLDPLDRYVGWLELNRSGKNKFPYLLVAAYCNVQGSAVLLGVISGNIMKVEKYAGPNAPEGIDFYIFAIGHQVTDLALREIGVKGVGTRLWKSATDDADEWINNLGGRFCYSVLEAEDESIGFWSKLGHLWPKGVLYWQPPLEFDESGQYKYPEVPEHLMLRPMEPTFETAIPRKFLQNIIATMYLNWSLDKYRGTLSSEAMRKAEDYVMGTLFRKVCADMPNMDPIPLVASLSGKHP